MHPVIAAHRAELLALARRHGMRSIKVFGSMARGDAGPDSDVDLLVEPEPEPGQSEPVRMFALGALLMDAEELLGRLWMW